MMMKNEYLKFAGKSADSIWEQADELYAAAFAGKGRVGYLPYLATVDAARYVVTKEPRFLERTKKALLDVYRFFEDLAAATGDIRFLSDTPMLDWMFEPAPYIKAFQMIQVDAAFTQEERAKIERVIESSVNPIFDFPEHGAENRCALKALNLIYAASAFPEHTMAKNWKKMAIRMIGDSVNHWSIEDASTYNTIWVYVLLTFHDAFPLSIWKENPFFLYYCNYFSAAQLNCGVFADYGDGRWGSDWILALACLEKGAALFGSGEFKYAAEKCFTHMETLDDGRDGSTWKTLPALVDAYFWSDDTIRPVVPTFHSRNVLDDLVGKKVVFRSANDKPEAFLLLNYRDEGNYGILPRHNLRTSLAVRAEKMHHGHADENSIAVLSVNDCILLHDGGYRSQLQDGAWRADFYHNRLIVRNDALASTQNIYNFIINAGSYVQVQTEQLYFYTFDRIDSTRTRVVDANHHVTSDRCIHYLKEENCFIVVDISVPQRSGEYTMSCLYHNRQVEKCGSHTYLSYSDFIASDEYLKKIPNGTNTKLLVDFLTRDLPTAEHDIARCYSQEKSFCQYFTGLANTDSNIVMVSLLIPQTDGETQAYTASCTQNERGVLTSLDINGKSYRIFDRFRLEGNLYDLNKRPAYSFEKGNSNLGGLETDGIFTAIIEEADALYYAFTDATRVNYKGKTLFQNRAIEHYQPSFVNEMGISSWSSWEEQLQK